MQWSNFPQNTHAIAQLKGTDSHIIKMSLLCFLPLQFDCQRGCFGNVVVQITADTADRKPMICSNLHISASQDEVQLGTTSHSKLIKLPMASITQETRSTSRTTKRKEKKTKETLTHNKKTHLHMT
jgi:hypothetical protein